MPMTLSDVNSLLFESPITFLLMGIMCTISVWAFLSQKFFATLLLHPFSIVKHREYFRIITSDFVHIDFLHLLFNQLMLYIFGSNLENDFGHKIKNGSYLMLLVYLGSMIFGNVALTLLHKDDFEYSSAGSSGSVMGCLFGYIIIDPHGKALNEPIIGGIDNLFMGLIYVVAMLLFKWKKKNHAINYDLHFYGAVGGVVTTLAILALVR